MVQPLVAPSPTALTASAWKRLVSAHRERCRDGLLTSALGNFYSSASPGNDVTLNLDALPARLPLVECGSGCSCSSGCTNRTTQLGVR